jgi:hypothetical protein
MKSLRNSLIIAFLLPVLLLHVLYPRANQNRLFDFIAGQSVLVSSFVMVPLLEISVLIVERIMLPTAIAASDKSGDTTGKKPAAPVDSVDYLIAAVTSLSFIVFARKLVLFAVNLWQQLCGSAIDSAGAIPSFYAVLTNLPFIKQCILRSNPFLPRGEPALLFSVA